MMMTLRVSLDSDMESLSLRSMDDSGTDRRRGTFPRPPSGSRKRDRAHGVGDAAPEQLHLLRVTLHRAEDEDGGSAAVDDRHRVGSPLVGGAGGQHAEGPGGELGVVA